MEQWNYNLLFRWFVGMGMDEVVWNHAVFSKNRERLLNEEGAEAFFQRVLERAKPYLSDEHFTVDGTLIEAWASQKASAGRTGANRPLRMGRKWIFMGRSGVTKRTNRPPIRMLGCIRSRRAAKRR